MAVSESFKSFIAEQFEPLGPIEIKRMFGGAGAFIDGRIFALLDDDILYFKVDDETVVPFDAEAMPPFQYPSKNGTMTMQAYRRCPERLFDDAEELIVWAKAAMAVAGRGPAKPKKTAKTAAGPKPSRAASVRTRKRPGGT